jgi:acetoin utilization deacetylase AcuC-like enzyme
MPRPVAVYYHPDCLLHDTGPTHPEASERLTYIKSALEAADFSHQLHWHSPDPAESRWIHEIHSPEYRQFIEEACLSGKHFADLGETVISHDSYHAALLSAGSAIGCVDAVLKEGYKTAFSLARPPGHHASTEKAMGFCLFNNIAVAAQYAEIVYGLERVCILDWDVHHGNGTQNIFYGSPTVLFCSLHQLPLYPDTGEHYETGSGSGKNLTINCPFPKDADIDLYMEVLDQDVLPTVRDFKPQLFLISAGFDAHAEDPLADIKLRSEDYYTLTKWITDRAREYSHGRVVSILEGGYNLRAIAESSVEHIRAFTEAG